MNEADFSKLFSATTSFGTNPYHPLVWIIGTPNIGRDVFIGAFSLINAKDTTVQIGDYCDIASFVAINAADSHDRCLGLSKDIERKPIVLEERVFVGSHSVIKGGAHIGHHSVVAAGTIVDGVHIPAYSLVSGNPMTVKVDYYRERLHGLGEDLS